MATKAELMASGLPAAAADKIGQDAQGTIAAAGASAGNATAVLTTMTAISTAPSNTGVILKNARGQPPAAIFNGGANTVKIYPATGEFINAGAANAAFSVGAGKACILIASGNRWIASLSA